MFHYQQHRKWWVASHRLLTDLGDWDSKLAQLIREFVVTSEVHTKFKQWSVIADHILQPIGGRKPIVIKSCPCNKCQENVAMLLAE